MNGLELVAGGAGGVLVIVIPSAVALAVLALLGHRLWRDRHPAKRLPWDDDREG